MNQNLIWLLETVLKCNNFSLNDEHYLQVNGTAIGTRIAPTYSNLFMDYLERKNIYKHDKYPRISLIFIDDIG